MLDVTVFSPLLATVVIFVLSFMIKDVSVKSYLAWIISTVSALVSFAAILIARTTGIESSTILERWLVFGSLTVELTYYWDAWSISIGGIAGFLTFLVLVFSKYYIGDNDHCTVYYGMVSTFLFGMELLIFSNNLIFTFLGWEIVGICSWFLIGFYHYRGGEEGKMAILSGQKALLVTGLADVGFLFALAAVPSFEITSLFGGEPSQLVLFGLLIAASGKSAQFPLHIWISGSEKRNIDAMQGPTTVSALIHAATMVNAGVFLVGRVIQFGSGISDYILWIGMITTVYAGLSACFSDDIKRVLAYSTISQLGLMFSALGAGALGDFVALWHLINHAFFKALLFLLAGFVIHVHGTRKLGELQNKEIPLLAKISFTIGLLALSGLPPFSGFFSKEHIIEMVIEHQNPLLSGLALLSSFITGVYAFRLLRLLVWNPPRGGKTPLIVRFVISVLVFMVLLTSASYYYLAIFSWYEVPTLVSGVNYTILGLALLGMTVGFTSSSWLPLLPSRLKEVLREGLYVDTFLTWTGHHLTRALSFLVSRFQTGINYWNFAFATISTILVGAIYFYIQFGGVF